MGAMTMEFKLAPGVPTAGVLQGGTVSFDLARTPEGELVISALRPAGAKPAMPAKPAGQGEHAGHAK
jgi:hypothetical protein